MSGQSNPDPRRAALQLDRAQQGGQAEGDTVQRPGRGRPGAFLRLEPFPIGGLLFGGFGAGLRTEYMRMTRYHLVGYGFCDRGKAEMPGLLSDLRMIDGLQQQVAQLALQLGHSAPVDGIGDFIRLFDGIGGNGLKGLFDVPGASGGRVAQPGHDRQQTGDFDSRVIGGVGRHCGRLSFAV